MANILTETVRGTDCIRIEDDLLSKREIFLTEEVNASTSNELLKQLMPRTDAILMTSGEKAVTVRKVKPYSMLEEAVAMERAVCYN